MKELHQIYEQYQGPICVPIAIEAALPDHLTLSPWAYKLVIANEGYYSEKFISLLEGKITRIVNVLKKFSSINEARFKHEAKVFLSTLLKEAQRKGENVVIYFLTRKNGHCRLVKCGKRDPNKIFAFDFFKYEDGSTEFGPAEIREGEMRFLFPKTYPYDDEPEEITYSQIFVFIIDENSPWIDRLVK